MFIAHDSINLGSLAGTRAQLKIPDATIQSGWFEKGAFASLVDFDSYWRPEALHEADKFCTDDVPQLDHYREQVIFATSRRST